MPIIDPSAQIPNVSLPSTGIDPTAGAAAPASTLSAHDAALIAESAKAFADPNLTAAQAGAQAGAAAAAAAGEVAAPNGNVAEVADEKTISQKIAEKIVAKKAQVVKLTEEIERLEGQFRSADLLDRVKDGSVIVARVGRADTAKEVTASVVGVQTLDNGDKRFKIFFGAGFDADTVVIQASQIVDVKQV